MPNSVLKIGNFTFPLLPRGSLDFDSDRSIAKIKAPGAPTVYQDMGFNEKTLDFSGIIPGSDAWNISQQIEAMEMSGQEYTLTYGSIQKQVRIQKYSPKFVRDDRVEYSINLLVVFPESMIDAMAGIPGSTTSTSTNTTTSASSMSPTAPAASNRTYTIKSGDTLWGIASRSDVFGDGSQWQAIAQANGITNEYALQIGQVIKIPTSSVTTQAVDSTGQSELQAIEGGTS